MSITRRDTFAPGASGAAPLLPTAAPAAAAPTYRREYDNHRIADLGGRRLLNPVLSGDRPDPAVLHVYDPWRCTIDWIVEGFSPERPKITRHGGHSTTSLRSAGRRVGGSTDRPPDRQWL